jgi:DNA-binding CsgD family transcriptional regulator
MAALTPRELQVLRLIGTGRSFKEIAGELAISLNTTHTHAKRIRAKRALPGLWGDFSLNG